MRELEGAIGNHEVTSDKAHEIRGFAETAGLRATGRIADGLCRYFEEMRKFGAEPDAGAAPRSVALWRIGPAACAGVRGVTSSAMGNSTRGAVLRRNPPRGEASGRKDRFGVGRGRRPKGTHFNLRI